MRGDRQVALGTALIGAAAFVLIATWAVPWDPVPGGMPDPVPAGSVFSDAEIDRAEVFSRWARLWSWSSLAVALVVACWLGFGRPGRWLSERMPGPWWVRVVLLVAALALIGRLVTLPFAIALRLLYLDAGLSTSSWAAWALDVLKAELIGVVITSLGLVALLGCARRWRQAWPAVAGTLLAGLVVGSSFVYPVVVEPMFNTFTPLEEGTLRTRILQLAEEEGVGVEEVLVSDASRRTTTLNAYVSGFGSTRRVVLYDTLVDDLPEDQALSVVAHELAHAKHDDVVIGTALGAAGALLGVGLLGVLLARGRWGEPSEVVVVPRVLALVAIAAVVAAPVQSGISRQIEARADVTALEATDAPGAFTELQKRLAVRSLADPTPPALAHWWFGSHPTVLERIAVARCVGQLTSPASPGCRGR